MTADLTSRLRDTKLVERRALAREKDTLSFDRTLAAARSFVNATLGHLLDGEGCEAELAELDELAKAAAAARDAMAERMLAQDDAACREIGRILGIGKSTAEGRYPKASARKPGGQPGHLR